MRIFFRVAFVLLIIGLLFGVVTPRVLGVAAPKMLGRASNPQHVFRLVGILPGDSHTEILEFHNDGSDPSAYDLVLVQQGGLWRCDPGGYDLTCNMAWSPGADQYLEPGETEWVEVTVTLPLAAGNTCQGKVGFLTVRKSDLETEELEDGGELYICCPSPFDRLSGKSFVEIGSMSKQVCGKAGWPLVNLLCH